LIGKYFYNPDDVIGEGAFGKVYRGFSAYEKSIQSLGMVLERI